MSNDEKITCFEKTVEFQTTFPVNLRCRSLEKKQRVYCAGFPRCSTKMVVITQTLVESFNILVEKFVYLKRNAVLLQNLFVNWYGLTSINGRPN